MEKLSKSQVDSLLSNKLYIKEINELESGEALKIHKNEWNARTHPYTYYYRNNKMRDIVKVVQKDDHYYIIKL